MILQSVIYGYITYLFAHICPLPCSWINTGPVLFSMGVIPILIAQSISIMCIGYEGVHYGPLLFPLRCTQSIAGWKRNGHYPIVQCIKYLCVSPMLISFPRAVSPYTSGIKPPIPSPMITILKAQKSEPWLWRKKTHDDILGDWWGIDFCTKTWAMHRL